MSVIGISISHDGTLSFVENGKHSFSIAEERINRVKAYIGFPFTALKHAIDIGMLKKEKVNSVAVSVNHFPWKSSETFAFVLTQEKNYYDIQNDNKPDNYFLLDDQWKKIKSNDECVKYVKKKLKTLLEKNGIKAPIHFYDHHLCHASSAYFASGFKGEKVLAVTMDGEGDGLSASINLCYGDKITKLSETDRLNSAGYIYSSVTKKCGFKISRHEGKITGLAAYGNPSTGYKYFSKFIVVEEGKLRIKSLKGFSVFDRVKNKLFRTFNLNTISGTDELINRLKGISDADLAASIQCLLEDRIEEIIRFWIKKTGVQNIVVAGGVFANVKFNQRIGELKEVNKFFVFPDMGDGGLAYGAAMLSSIKQNKVSSNLSKIKTVYLGQEYSNNEVKGFLNEYDNLSVRLSKNIAKDTASLIANKKIVGWFQGRMEYGPRALGNRSILATPIDNNINQWLNERLKRTEFMPFAPSCLYEFADELFEIPKASLKFPAEFMTITFKMKRNWIEKAPAVAHIDNTARPQLVKKNKNPLYYSLLDEFYKLTGLPLLINTSFNVHEEPIVCHPKEAIRALTSNMIDVLVIGNFVVKLK